MRCMLVLLRCEAGPCIGGETPIRRIEGQGVGGGSGLRQLQRLQGEAC